MPDLSEVQIQAAFKAQLRYIAPRVHCVAVPNGARRTQWEANRALREGMSPGFPDLICLWPGGICFIEFKARRGRVSPNQEDWLDRLDRMGFVCGIARSVEDAVAILRRAGGTVTERAA